MVLARAESALAETVQQVATVSEMATSIHRCHQYDDAMPPSANSFTYESTANYTFRLTWKVISGDSMPALIQVTVRVLQRR
ncbi:hypothetical protein Bxe_C0380 [Paraburkholderia xenovorans LB400]|uniref:Uncharacterized protein n=1 Tax=Paraburkholderia xenovorans (strain LB400) TaxID=266265 RepID=Q13I02_PARXL|nr:hypothetical protein Bxe_C0380 [Paraburkholderia xenovorans LB400]